MGKCISSSPGIIIGIFLPYSSRKLATAFGIMLEDRQQQNIVSDDKKSLVANQALIAVAIPSKTRISLIFDGFQIMAMPPEIVSSTVTNFFEISSPLKFITFDGNIFARRRKI
jgi:hypothetical protein